MAETFVVFVDQMYYPFLDVVAAESAEEAIEAVRERSGVRNASIVVAPMTAARARRFGNFPVDTDLDRFWAEIDLSDTTEHPPEEG